MIFVSYCLWFLYLFYFYANTSQHSHHETYPVPLQQCYNSNPIAKDQHNTRHQQYKDKDNLLVYPNSFQSIGVCSSLGIEKQNFILDALHPCFSNVLLTPNEVQWYFWYALFFLWGPIKTVANHSVKVTPFTRLYAVLLWGLFKCCFYKSF